MTKTPKRSIAAAEVARPVRYVNALLGATLFVYDADLVATVASIVSGAAHRFQRPPRPYPGSVWQLEPLAGVAGVTMGVHRP